MSTACRISSMALAITSQFLGHSPPTTNQIPRAAWVVRAQGGLEYRTQLTRPADQEIDRHLHGSDPICGKRGVFYLWLWRARDLLGMKDDGFLRRIPKTGTCYERCGNRRRHRGDVRCRVHWL